MNSTSLSANEQSGDLRRQKLNRFIDLDRYPIDRLDSTDGQALVAQCRKDLETKAAATLPGFCLLYTSPSPRDATLSRMPSSA